MTDFDQVIAVDWSGGNDRGPGPKADAIWACRAAHGTPEEPQYFRNRGLVEPWLADAIQNALDSDKRLLVGFDFPMGFPKGFAQALTGDAHPYALWDWFAQKIEDSPKANNRFDVAGAINARYPAPGPFWGNALKRDIDALPRKKPRDYAANGVTEYRQAETLAKGSFPVWQLSGAGSVGSQTLMGLPVLSRLRARFAGQIGYAPGHVSGEPIVLCEIWPSLFVGTPPGGMIKDAYQVREVARRISALGPGAALHMLDAGPPEEGWIFGLGHEEELRHHG